MAKKKVQRPGTLATRRPATVSTRTSVTPASLMQSDRAGNIGDVEMAVPKGFDDATELPSSLTPVFVFNLPGEYVEGTYKGKREDIGAYGSTMYDVEVTDKDTGEVVVGSVWGGTVLDTRMSLYEPPVGSKILIQYLGTFAAKANQNPARNFRVRYK